MDFHHIHDCEPDWGPLREFALRHRDAEIQVNPNMFMYMGRVSTGGGGTIHLYKNWWTRRYLNLDNDLRPWRYVCPPNWREVDDPGWYEKIRGRVGPVIRDVMVIELSKGERFAAGLGPAGPLDVENWLDSQPRQ